MKAPSNNNENFPSLGTSEVTSKITLASQWSEPSSAPALPVTRQTRKGSAEKRTEEPKQTEDAATKAATTSTNNEKHIDRQVSESRERNVQQKTRERSISSKKDDIIYVRKGKEIKTSYDKDALLNIFLQIRDTIVPTTSILAAAKDDFIPVINTAAPKEIELTKPTEVELNVTNFMYDTF